MTALTKHGAERRQQRSVPPVVIDWLLAYGIRTTAGGGLQQVYFDKNGRKKLQHDVGMWAYGRLEEKLNVYAVVAADESIVTVGYRTKRRNHI
jgi:hypothetical protein